MNTLTLELMPSAATMSCADTLKADEPGPTADTTYESSWRRETVLATSEASRRVYSCSIVASLLLALLGPSARPLVFRSLTPSPHLLVISHSGNVAPVVSHDAVGKVLLAQPHEVAPLNPVRRNAVLVDYR